MISHVNGISKYALTVGRRFYVASICLLVRAVLVFAMYEIWVLRDERKPIWVFIATAVVAGFLVGARKVYAQFTLGKSYTEISKGIDEISEDTEEDSGISIDLVKIKNTRLSNAVNKILSISRSVYGIEYEDGLNISFASKSIVVPVSSETYTMISSGWIPCSRLTWSLDVIITVITLVVSAVVFLR